MSIQLVYGMSTKADGNMSTNWGSEEEVIENRVKFMKSLGVDYKKCVMAKLKHETGVAYVEKKDAGRTVEADALVTKDVGLGLFMVTADCLPLILFDNNEAKIALVHLGWRGVNGKLAPKVLNKFVNPAGVKAIIGPGVKKGTYKKWGNGWDEFLGVVGKIGEWEEFVEDTVDGKKTLDLVGYAAKQLSEVGVEDVSISPIDTVEDKDYYSHHRSYLTGEPEGRFATVVMMRAG